MGRVTTLTANYSMRIGRNGSLSLSASRSEGAASGSSLGLSFVLPLEKGPVYVASATSSQGRNDYYLAATRPPDTDNGFGWRVLAGNQQTRRREEAGFMYLGRYGSLTGDASNSPDQTTFRFNGTGGMVLTEGNLFATARGMDSYALVEVAGYENVGVGLTSNNQTRTNAEGLALIPRLNPYQSNAIRLTANDLPISAELDSIEKQVVPAWRSVVKAKFPVRSGRGALLRIRFDDGEVAPIGAIVQIEGDNQEFYVARRGEAFVTGLQPNNRLSLKWKEARCGFEVTLPPESPDDIPRIGPLLCNGVKR